VRKDVLAQLWDFGVSEYTYEAPVDPYGGGDVSVEASVVFGRIGTNPGELSTPRNVAVGPDGNVYIADSGNHRIQVFDSDGAFLSTFGTFGNEAGQFNEPWGLAVDDQFIYVADTWNFRLQKFTLDGTWVQTIGTGGSPAEGETGGNLYFGPRDIVLLPENRLLVSDTGNHRLQLIDRNGTFISQVGGYGFEPGKLYEPVGIAAGPDGTLYVADTWNRRVQSFTADLLPLNQFAVNGWQSESLNNKPYLAVDSLGRIYVTDPEGYRVLIFAADGRFIGRFGTFGSDLIGGVDIPNGITIDADNNVYVVDSNNGRVLKFGALPADLGTISGAEPPAELNPDAIQQSGDDLLFPPEESAPADAAYPDP
jgi:sugar lactone lactonase YvrE